jgi:predicted nucleic acid-binding protein
LTTFVDTSVFYAAVDRGDERNLRAKAVLREGVPLLTSAHVVVETWMLLSGRLGHSAAERWWAVVRSGTCSVEQVLPADMELAWTIGEAFADQAFSIVDRTTFAVMQRMGIERVATFDRLFAAYRYGPARKRAFLVVD